MTEKVLLRFYFYICITIAFLSELIKILYFDFFMPINGFLLGIIFCLVVKIRIDD